MFRCFRKFVFTKFLTTWMGVEIVMCNSRLVINSIFWSYSLHFLLVLNAVHFVYNVFKQIIIYGRQFEFTQVKVIQLGVEHYNYNTCCGNNNVRHNYSDHACLPSRVPKMEGADLNNIILWLWFLFFGNISVSYTHLTLPTSCCV